MTKSTAMKAVLPFLVLLAGGIIVACSGGLLEKKQYNLPVKDVDLDTDYVKTFAEYRTNFYENPVDSTNGMISNISWSFISINPVNRDETGNFYYRWGLFVETYDSYDNAVKAYNILIDKLGELTPEELKGSNTRNMIQDNRIYCVSAGCLEGRYVDEWFGTLTKLLLDGKEPEKESVIVTGCGGEVDVK